MDSITLNLKRSILSIAASAAFLPALAAAQDAAITFRVAPALGDVSTSVINKLTGNAGMLDTPSDAKGALALADQLTIALRKSGYPAGLVVITEPDWKAAQDTGKFVYTVFPGVVGKISVDNSSRVSQEKVASIVTDALCNSAGQSKGQPCLLSQAGIERAAQLLQDTPGVGMLGYPRLSPGADSGTVDVVFPTGETGKQFSYGVVADNNGQSATGKFRAGVTVSADNLFHAGEQFSATLMETAKHALTGAVSGSVPIGGSGLRLAGSVTRQQYAISTVTNLAGTSTVVQGGLTFPFIRGLDKNLTGGAWLVHNDSSVEFTDYGFGTHSSINSIQFSLNGNNGDRPMILRGDRWGWSGALTVGNDSTNDPGDVVAKRGGGYGKLAASAYGVKTMGEKKDLFINGSISGQLASRNLDGSELLVTGGPNAVRAYSTGEASFNDGAVINLGVSKALQVATGHQLQLGVFMDVGYGRLLHSAWAGATQGYAGNTGNTRLLAGYGVQASWLTPWGATVTGSVAKALPFSAPSTVNGKKPAQFWLSVTWSK